MAFDWNQLEEAYGFDAGVAQNIGYGATGAQAQTSQAENGSLVGRLFGGTMTEEDRIRLQMMDSGLQRVATSFQGVGGAAGGQPYSRPYNGANFSIPTNEAQSSLGALLQSLIQKRGL